MIRSLWHRRPGLARSDVRPAAIIAIALVTLAGVYEWVGATFLDPGGAIG
ncbi:MAG TPA: hypothetical protein VLD62_05710 [Acidimicrobiia bacterium]|nr:hypothetical protein [Acidimicrobiia bacterium]